jgi:hypothetical protein
VRLLDGETRIDKLLGELCSKYGFCLKPAEYAEMRDMSTDDLDSWTTALFVKEGLVEYPEKKLWREVRRYVQRRLAVLPADPEHRR